MAPNPIILRYHLATLWINGLTYVFKAQDNSRQRCRALSSGNARHGTAPQHTAPNASGANVPL